MTLAETLGIERPIIQAPMAGVQGSELAIAVCNAGGLGSLPCAMLDAETMAAEISRIKGQTAQPFNVNFFCHTPPVIDAARELRWREALKPYFEELGLNVDEIKPGPGRQPFSAEIADVLAEFKPPVVSFHFGLPAPELVDRVKSWGAKVLVSATTVDEAVWLESRGADVIIAQGTEAGGHRGSFLSNDLSLQMGTFALVPQVVARVKVPVVAAGGIATAQEVAAVMNLGAAGVQVGTSYLLCPEVSSTAIHRAALKSEAARHTAITNVFTGRPARGIVNRLIREQGPINETAPQFPMAAAALAPLRSYVEAQGAGDFSSMWAGQNTTGCREVSAAVLTQELVSGL
ncbi:MAG: nitronate monooxygenase [Porticoccaceae bacterium]|nr:nitronate monooxygenase [Pseudomonadales bacterium]MCP5171219.1 nitronate monooxygenase [Pseudomonadales bacterium]MCP5301542.1 nitronate monooxygenase [Pseudomonadales bacterium]